MKKKNKNKNKNKNIGSLFFWIGYALVLFPVFFVNVIAFQPFADWLGVAGLVVLFGYMITKNLKLYPMKNNAKHYILMAVFFAVFLLSSNYAAARFLIIAYSLCMIPYRDFLKRDLYIRGALFVLLLLLLAFGACETTFRMRGDVVRYTLGFSHPNTAGFFLMTIGLEYVYVYRDRPMWQRVLVVVVLACVIILLTGSRACAVSLSVFAIACCLKSILVKIPESIKRMSYVLPILLTGVSMAVVLLFYSGAQPLSDINIFLSYRIQYAFNAISNIGFSLFGSIIPQNVVVLDNAYIYYLLACGVVPYAVFITLLCVGVKTRMAKANDSMFLLIISILFFYGLAEKMVFMASFSPFLVGTYPVLYLFARSRRSAREARECLKCQ